MLQCGTHLIFGHVELPEKMRPARHQLTGLDGDALPLLEAPIGREQQVKVKAGGVRFGSVYHSQSVNSRGNATKPRPSSMSKVCSSCLCSAASITHPEAQNQCVLFWQLFCASVQHKTRETTKDLPAEDERRQVFFAC